MGWSNLASEWEKKKQELGQSPTWPDFFINCRQNCKNRHFSSDPDPDPEFGGSGDPDPDEFEFPDPDPEKMTRIRHTDCNQRIVES